MAWLLFIGGASKVNMQTQEEEEQEQEEEEEEEEEDAGFRSQLVRWSSTLERQNASRVTKIRKLRTKNPELFGGGLMEDLKPPLINLSMFLNIIRLKFSQYCKSFPNILVTELKHTLLKAQPWIVFLRMQVLDLIPLFQLCSHLLQIKEFTFR